MAAGAAGGVVGGVIDLGGVGDDDGDDEEEDTGELVSEVVSSTGKASAARGSDSSNMGIVIARDDAVPRLALCFRDCAAPLHGEGGAKRLPGTVVCGIVAVWRCHLSTGGFPLLRRVF